MDSIWRLICDGSCDPYWNMAVDEAIFRSFCAGQCPPTVRFYTWERTSISLGRFQNLDKSIDQNFCTQRGIPIVRRPTGGRAVLHGTDVTFAVVKQSGGNTIEESYTLLSRAVMDALLSVGVPALPFGTNSDRKQMGMVSNCFELHGRFEVALDGQKVFGCAQLREQGNILQQNALILEAPASDNLNAFIGGCPGESNSCVARYADGNTVVRAICGAAERAFGVSLETAELTAEEDELAHQLRNGRYQVDNWNRAGRRVVDTQITSVIY